MARSLCSPTINQEMEKISPRRTRWAARYAARRLGWRRAGTRRRRRLSQSGAAQAAV